MKETLKTRTCSSTENNYHCVTMIDVKARSHLTRKTARPIVVEIILPIKTKPILIHNGRNGQGLVRTQPKQFLSGLMPWHEEEGLRGPGCPAWCVLCRLEGRRNERTPPTPSSNLTVSPVVPGRPAGEDVTWGYAAASANASFKILGRCLLLDDFCHAVPNPDPPLCLPPPPAPTAPPPDADPLLLPEWLLPVFPPRLLLLLLPPMGQGGSNPPPKKAPGNKQANFPQNLKSSPENLLPPSSPGPSQGSDFQRLPGEFLLKNASTTSSL